MDWYFVALSLVVPEPLVEGLFSYLEAEDRISPDSCPPDLIKPDENHVIDYPGMCSMRRNLHVLEVDGLTFKIPSTDFARAFREIGRLPLCHEGGIPHYRFYGSIRCLCMTPSQREHILREMGKQLSSAVEIADWENRQMNAAMGGNTKPARIDTNGNENFVEILEEPAKHNLICTPRPVIDRDIEEV